VNAPNPRNPSTDTSQPCQIAALYLHPIKSCAGLSVASSELVETGLDLDRAWMVVNPHGEMLTQRELPRMVLITTALRSGDLVLRAPGMLALHVKLDTVEAATRVQVWGDVVKAYDMGPLAAQWFTDFLGQPLRLARFDPEQQRLADPAWAGAVAAETAFADGFPLLVCSTASLADLNTRLVTRGVAPVTMERFRPNLVLDGLQAFDEDHIDDIVIDAVDGPVVLRLVKPCTRCTIPSVDPATGVQHAEPSDTLASYRTDKRVGGGITFGMNAVVVEGFGLTLRVGQRGQARWAF